jgi:DNA-binding FadR family transcriptional regulator
MHSAAISRYGLLDSLGRKIVTGSYDRRPFPTEAQLADEYAVSRSVTREAVKMLTAKGLLSARPRQGTIVLPRASWNLFDADVLHWLAGTEIFHRSSVAVHRSARGDRACRRGTRDDA